MSIIRFVHAADLHLDSPFTGLRNAAPEHVAQTLYDATFAAYENLIDLCIRERVDALLVAGDIYDGADRSLRAQHKFIDGLERLDSEGIRSFVCHGNHDPLDGWEARLNYPAGCHRFVEDFEAVPVFAEDPSRVVVHGISYWTRDVYENLVLRLGRVDSGPFSIGLLHANVGSNPDHAVYAPCTLADLAESGIDYWALGHIHTRQTLSEHRPTVVYPGNTQGRHANETGARGAYLVDVSDSGNVRLDFRPLDIVRWEHIEIDISGLDSDQHLLNAVHNSIEEKLDSADGRPIIVRLALSGRGEVSNMLRRSDAVDDLRTTINDEWAKQTPFAWCERIENNTASPLDRSARLEGVDFMAEILKTADAAGGDANLRERLRDGLPDLYQHRRFRRYLSGAAPTDEDFAAILEEAESMVVDLLSEDDKR